MRAVLRPATCSSSVSARRDSRASATSRARTERSSRWIRANTLRARAEVESEFPEVDMHCGGFDAPVFGTAAEIVVSPGVSVREPALRVASARGVPIIGDIELFARAGRRAGGRDHRIEREEHRHVAGLGHGTERRSAGRSGGNLGPPALSLLGRGYELYVLELSSFQLETTSALRPAAATVLNVSADHMDRYESFDAYVAAKSRVLRADTVVVANLDDPVAARLGGDRCGGDRIQHHGAPERAVVRRGKRERREDHAARRGG